MPPSCVVCKARTATNDAASIDHYYCSEGCRQHDWRVDAPLRSTFRQAFPSKINITSTVATFNKGHCCVCDHITDLVCSACKVTYYCTDKCRAEDGHNHSLLCQSFLLSTTERPGGEYIRGLFFPMYRQAPEWVWLPYDHEVYQGGQRAICVKLEAVSAFVDCNGEEHDCTAIVDHVTSGRQLQERAITVYHHAQGDNKAVNQSILAASNGQVLLRGDMLVVGELLPNDLQLRYGASIAENITKEDLDLTPNDARLVLMDCKLRLSKIWKHQEPAQLTRE